jgi:Fe-S-cluster-containing dehydrogenase component
MAHYVMVIDTRKCVGCQSCTVACRIHNELKVEHIYNPVVTIGPVGVFPHLHMNFVPLLCMHCQNTPCVDACPSKASQQTDEGIVWVDQDKCVGCKSCIMACPYGARLADHETGTVRKCNFCKDRVEVGDKPFCVNTCHQKARTFGDLEDPDSEVFKLVYGEHAVCLLANLNTQPSVYYIYGAEGK